MFYLSLSAPAQIDVTRSRPVVLSAVGPRPVLPTLFITTANTIFSDIITTDNWQRSGMASRLETAPSVQSSQAEVWYLKNILFGPPGREKKEYKIITQNSNGYVSYICAPLFALTSISVYRPCSFIAICKPYMY